MLSAQDKETAAVVVGVAGVAALAVALCLVDPNLGSGSVATSVSSPQSSSTPGTSGASGGGCGCGGSCGSC